MALAPRLAIGSAQAGYDARPVVWALLAALRAEGLQVQTFVPQACFANDVALAAVTGIRPRHLDSWLMGEARCREVFLHGSATCDLAVLAGDYAAGAGGRRALGGRMEPLCDWLRPAVLVVLDARRLAGGALPIRPATAQGVFLSHVAGMDQFAALRARIDAQWNVPVLGFLRDRPDLRTALAVDRPEYRPAPWLLEELRAEFLRTCDLRQVRRLAQACPPLAEPPGDLFSQEPPARRETVIALAYDEAFHYYFPDLLDVLEWNGAEIIDFSPLHDDRLPPGTDLVYVGGGHPEFWSDDLTRNDCMRAELRNHFRSGKRIYAEGGGLAYLSHRLALADGGEHRMVGLFPAIAHRQEVDMAQIPVEVTLERTTWLGEFGTRLGGYRDTAWRLEPTGFRCGCVAQPERRHDLVYASQAVGSQLYLDFVARPDVLANFFEPCTARAEILDPWLTLL